MSAESNDARQTIEVGTVACAACGVVVGDDEAQAQRWGYWSDGRDELYPLCGRCARRRFFDSTG